MALIYITCFPLRKVRNFFNEMQVFFNRTRMTRIPRNRGKLQRIFADWFGQINSFCGEKI